MEVSPTVFWNALNAIASTVSMVAFVLTAVYVRGQLKALEKDRFLNVTNDLFTVFQSNEFMQSQLWILHTMKETTWADFVAAHRGDTGEIAFHRVGSFYDRVGSLIRLNLVNQEQILPTIGGYAIAVWQKIAPLVKEARRIENSSLFDGFERMLPACYECYVPALADGQNVKPFSLIQPSSAGTDTIAPRDLARRLKGDDRPTVLDVRRAEQVEADPKTLPHALWVLPELVESIMESLPRDRDIVVLCA